MGRTVQGNATWGIGDADQVTGVSGVITDLSISTEAIMEPQRNEVGAVIQQSMYDERTQVTATVEVAAGGPLPAKGSQITIAGVQGYVLNARRVASNSRYQAIEITVELYKHCSAVNEV